MRNRDLTTSIIICTHNRAADLIDCLEGLLASSLPAGCEVLVVDSASSPEHASRIGEYLAARPFIRHHRLETPGTALARNTAATLAEGKWIWWLDDDAIPEPGWPESLDKAIAEADDTTAVIGGKIIPIYAEGGDASQLTDRWKMLVTCIETDQAGDVADGFNVACANMLMRRDLILAVGGFSQKVGRVGHEVLLSGEENLLIERLADAGYRSVYTPELVVRHKVSAQRLQVAWVGRRAYGEGYSNYVIRRELGRPITLSMHPLKLRLSILFWNMLGAVLPRNPDIVIRKNMAQGALDAGKTYARVLTSALLATNTAGL